MVCSALGISPTAVRRGLNYECKRQLKPCRAVAGGPGGCDLPADGEETDLALYRQGAVSGFADPAIRAGANEVLRKARAALCYAGQAAAVAALAPLERLLAARRTPADDLLGAYREPGLMYHRADQRAT
jgi:hypothetical protein